MDHILHSAQSLALRRGLCFSCRQRWMSGHKTTTTLEKAGLQNSDRIQRRFKGYIAPEGGQARPIEGFYAGMNPYMNYIPSN
jgi:hypothetical protein